MAKPTKPERETMTVSLPKPMVEQIDRLVQDELITRSAFIRRAVHRAVIQAIEQAPHVGAAA